MLFPESTTVFKNVLQKPTKGTVDWEEKYKTIGEELLEIIKEMNMEENEYIFEPSDKQAEIFCSHFQKMLDYAYTMQHSEAISSVFRVALMSAKIMMVYAVLLGYLFRSKYPTYFGESTPLLLAKFNLQNYSLVALHFSFFA